MKISEGILESKRGEIFDNITRGIIGKIPTEILKVFMGDFINLIGILGRFLEGIVESITKVIHGRVSGEIFESPWIPR